MAKQQQDGVFLPEERSAADFILVQKKKKPDAVKLKTSRFLRNLKRAGLTVEIVDGIKFPQYVFIKLRAPEEALKHLAILHGLFPTYQDDKTTPNYSKRWGYFKTPISKRPNIQDPLFQRCSNSVRGQPNTTYTSAERISLVSYVLTRTKYGALPNEHGLGRLLDNKIFDDAYPLHDGTDKWMKSGALNDRQILAKYWGNWKMFYKFQPIHIIFKYYGSEIAFHYAWLEFYTKTLIFPSILGIIVTFLGYYDMYLSNKVFFRIKEVCESDLKMCPSCTHEHCLYKNLNAYCKTAKESYMLDNEYTVGFAVSITIWAMFFLELWNREENVLKYKWNLEKSTPEIDELPNYKDRVRKFTKHNKYTQTDEHYTPFMMKMGRYICSFLGVSAFILLLLTTTAGILISIHLIKYYVVMHRIPFIEDYLPSLTRVYSAFLMIILIKIYSPMLVTISKKLTDKEFHRTQNDYINSYIFKSYILSFINSYIMTFYNAFFKDVNYTHPGDHGIYNKMFGVASDICPPVIGCIQSLSTHVSFAIWKNYILMLMYKSYLITSIFNAIKSKFKKKNQNVIQNVPQWEEEFSLTPTNPTFFVQSFMTIVIEYGFLTFFAAAVPLLPLFVLINNIVELRVTAMKLVRKTRRNVPKRVLGLGSWRTVLLIVTRISYFISGCVISFTSAFVHRTVYYFEHNSLKGFVNDTIAEFLVDHYREDIRDNLRQSFPDVDTCFYPGMKNSYNHPEPYQESDRYYELLSIKLVTVVVFIHAVYFLNGILSFWIPQVPRIITESQAYDDKKQRMKVFENVAPKSGKN